MTQIPPGSNSSSSDAARPDPEPKPRKKRLRKIVLIAAAVLLVLVVILLFLTPTILSSDSVREAIVDHINSTMLNGQLSIHDWSLSWRGGVEAHGIDVTDASNAHVLSIAQLTSGVSLLGAISGHIDLGDTELTGVDFNLRRDKDGQFNLAKLFEKNPPAASGASAPGGAPAGPSKLPLITGTIHFNGRTCTYQDDVPAQPILATFETLDGTIKITDINQPIETHLDVAAHVNGQPATLKLDGTISAVQNQMLDIDNAAAAETIAFSTGNSAADVQASVDAQRGGPLGILIPSLDIAHAQFDLHLLQEQHFLDLLAANWLAKNSVRFNSGVITLAGKGKLDASGITLDQPLALHVDPIELTSADSTGTAQTAHLPPLDIQVTSAQAENFTASLILGTSQQPLVSMNLTGSPAGSAQLTQCDADLPRLQAALAPVLPLFAARIIPTPCSRSPRT